MADFPPCADVSRALEEPLVGTASRIRNWLLIEHAGDWGREVLSQSSLDDGFKRELKRRADRNRIRVLLIRRPGAGDSGGRCYAVHSGAERQWIHRVEADDPETVLDLDFAELRKGLPPALGVEHDRPLYLVCTHREHDPCCGRFGATVAERLAGERPEETWESSHVGGDRFAANLVCLPHGLYFGRVPAERAGHIAGLYERGVIDLEHYRGRSGYDAVVQAAETLIRSRDRIDGIEDLTFESRHDAGAGRCAVTFVDRDGAGHRIQIAVHRAAPRRITCDTTRPGSPREYRVVNEGPVSIDP